MFSGVGENDKCQNILEYIEKKLYFLFIIFYQIISNFFEYLFESLFENYK